MRHAWNTSKLVALYGAAFAVGAFALHWLENQYVVSLFSTDIYIIILAVAFTVLGVWIGSRLRNRPYVPSYERNERAIKALGLTNKEVEVLERLALGGSNQEIADQLCVSKSTVKSHLIHLYQKLEVSRRTQAIQKGRLLKIIP